MRRRDVFTDRIGESLKKGGRKKNSKNPLASQVPTHEWNDGTIQEDFLRPGHDDK